MQTGDVYSFISRGLLTEESLDRAGRKKSSNFTSAWEAETSARLGLVLLDEDGVARARKMSVVYTAICAFENSVRDFISKKLLEEKGENWWNECVKPEIQTKAQSRKDSEKDVRWLTARGDSLIYYTDFGDLVAIVAKHDNWIFFEVHIRRVDWAKQIFETLEKSRNIIMHGGELSPTDIDRVGMYIRDWVQQVG